MPELLDLPAPSKTPEPAAHSTKNGVTWRAFAVGLPLMSALCVLSIYADMVSRVVQFGVLQLAPPALVALALLALFNQGLSRLTRREWLGKGDLLAIYAMLLVGVMISTRGVMERLVPSLVYLPYYATRENRFNELLTQHLPAWAVPFVPSGAATGPSDAVRAFHEGGAPVPWSVWLGPLVAWFGLVACVIWVFLCMATILRRQWADNEQLRFPLTTLPLAIIRNESEGQHFWTNRMMWAGCALSAGVFLVNGLSANNSDWPKIITELNLSPYFSERPWNQMDYTPVYMSLAAIGFAFFLPLDLLFSFWFFFLLTRMQDVAAVQMGGLPVSMGTHNARIWTGYQASGAYIALALAQARIGWPYYKQVWRTAFGRIKPLDDSSELMPYRVAVIGLFAGFGGIVLWLSLAGMSPILALAQMGIYLFLVALIMSRGVAEGGLLMTETSFLPSNLIALVYPLPSLGATNLTMMGATNALFARDLRGVLLSPFLDDQKMATELGMKPRSLLLPLLLAVVVAFAVASYTFLSLNYDKGSLALYGYPKQNAMQMFGLAAAQTNGSAMVPDATAYGGFGVGIILTALMVWARTSFSWFPFHPLGYALAPTWAMIVLWFPFLAAWVIKSGVMRFGGIETFRKVAPFMLGLILGEFSSAVFWSVMNLWRGWSTPSFPWP
jgi:hypothetical protein